MVAAQHIINDKQYTVFNEDANTVIKKIQADVLYLDPPYNHRQYAPNYHVLETISRYDNPILHGKTGLRDYATQKSNYCLKNKVRKSFEELVMNAKAKYIFMSYNNEGLMSLDEIKNIMSLRGEYGVFTKEYNRFKADKTQNRKRLADNTTEYLHYVVVK
jgi:adenine-specific DNA-methyltransferase